MGPMDFDFAIERKILAHLYYKIISNPGKPILNGVRCR